MARFLEDPTVGPNHPLLEAFSNPDKTASYGEHVTYLNILAVIQAILMYSRVPQG